MHIVLTADPELPVPPRLYGGIERVISMLVRELRDRGHRITLFAHPESSASGAELVPWAGSNSRSRVDTMRNCLLLSQEIRRRKVDIIHSFSRIAYLLPLLPWPIPKLMSYQRPVTRRSVNMAKVLSGGSLEFTAVSQWMMNHVLDIGRWSLVPNGVPLATFPYVADPGSNAPLVFLGRVEEIKGPHLAVEVAKRTGLPLVIAGNVPHEHQNWFDGVIAPHLGDQIRYLGAVDDQQKAWLLGHARALMMPILWNEPFGIVMAEAMACGTPVLGLRRGAVPEVVEHGVSGLVVDKLEELVTAVQKLPQIKRLDCRTRVEKLFSSSAVASGYLDLYGRMVCRASV